jgi:hypothetical protein
VKKGKQQPIPVKHQVNPNPKDHPSVVCICGSFQQSSSLPLVPFFMYIP